MCWWVSPDDPSATRHARGATRQSHRESRTESAGPFRGRRRWRFFSSRLRRSIRVEEVRPNTACVSPLLRAKEAYARRRRFQSWYLRSEDQKRLPKSNPTYIGAKSASSHRRDKLQRRGGVERGPSSAKLEMKLHVGTVKPEVRSRPRQSRTAEVAGAHRCSEDR